MPRFNEIINNFINGEVSPKLYGRSDSEIYKRSTRNTFNMINHPQGGASRRGGTQFVLDKLFIQNTGEEVDLVEGARIFEFIYSKDEAYLIIFPAIYTGFKSLGYPFYIYNIQDGTISRPFFSGGSSAGFAGDSSLGEGTAVSNNQMTSATLLSEIQYAQNGAIMYFAHQDLVPFYIARVAKNSFIAADFYRPFFGLAGTYTEVDSWKNWPYRDINVSATTITASATTGNITLTASTATFTADLVGTNVILTNAGIVGAARITGFTSTTVVNATVLRTMPGIAAYTTWYLSAWSKATGYPRSVAFYDNRAVWGFTKSEPEKIWFSQEFDIAELGNLNTLNPAGTRVSSDPASFSPASVQANGGMWLRGGSGNLLIGTRGAEYSVQTLSGTIPFAVPRQQTSYGSEAIQPALVDDVPVFVQRGFKKIRELVFDYRTEGYVAPEVTFYAEHIFNKSQELLGDLYVSKVKYMAYQALDDNILWIVDNNGYLYGCTKSRENSVTAFHRHELGAGNTEFEEEFIPQIKSIAALPGRNGTSDALYMLVKRKHDSIDKFFIEKIDGSFTGTTLHSDTDTRENQPVFLDCAKIFRTKNANFWAELRIGFVAQLSGGSPVGTSTGSISISASGRLYATAAGGYVTWDGTSNADFQQAGCVEFTWFANGAPAGTATLLSISRSAGNTNNLIEILVTTTGNVQLTILDQASAPIVNTVTIANLSTLGIYPFTDTGQRCSPIHFELNYNCDLGQHRLFVNGKQLGATISGTGTRSSLIDLIRLNADESGNNSRADFVYSGLRIYNTVQHTADFEVFPYAEASDETLEWQDQYTGKVVGVLEDGIYVGEVSVGSNSITLSDVSETVIVGFNYDNYIEIQPVDAGTGIGSAIGSIKRIDRAVIKFQKTAAAQVGPSLTSLEEIVFRTASTPITDPIVLVTDEKVVDFRGDYEREAKLVVFNDQPLPCNVTCVSLRGVTSDV